MDAATISLLINDCKKYVLCIHFIFQKSLGLVVDYLAQDPKFVKILAKTLYDFQDELVVEPENPEFHRPVPSKKNSELLNSLLGLPKNILKSG